VVALHRFWTATVDEAKERRILIDAFVCVQERDSFVAMCVYIERTKRASSDFVLTKLEKKDCFSTFYA